MTVSESNTMLLKCVTTTIVVGGLLLVSCEAPSPGKFDTFLSRSKDTTRQLYFTETYNSKERLYVAHVNVPKWEYGSALDFEGDTFLINGNWFCRYYNEDTQVRILDFTDPKELYMINLDSNGKDSLFHYTLLTDRGKRLNAPQGTEYVTLVYHKQNGIVGVYLLIRPNRETNPTSKDVAAYLRGNIGLVDTSKITIYLPEQISNHIE
jgi:hypothetical protein